MQLGTRFFLWLLGIGLATFAVHESAHWITGIMLGYPMQASPNRVWSSTPMTPADALLVSAAGPVVTIAQGMLGFLLVRRSASRWGFAMLYMAFFTRLLAMAVSLFNPNDEARISAQLGLGTWTLPALVVLVLFVLVYAASRRLELTWRDQLVCYIVASVTVTLVVGIDRIVF